MVKRRFLAGLMIVRSEGFVVPYASCLSGRITLKSNLSLSLYFLRNSLFLCNHLSPKFFR